MTKASKYDYDVALSFANEDRAYVERVANALKNKGLRVFYDLWEAQNLWGKNLYTYLNEIYSARAKYTILFISRNYARKVWTNHERVSSQARALAEHREYILPAKFDDTEVPGIPSTIGYIDLNRVSPEEFADLVASKIISSSESILPVETDIGRLIQQKKRRKDSKPANEELPLLLYSVNTSLAFRINEQFYRQIHYSWCAPYFDMRRNQISGIGKSPPSSNPFEIYASFLRDARSGDLHSPLIKQNKAGILRGAQVRIEKGQITPEARHEIEQILDVTVASDYTPLIYVIPTHSIRNLIKKVDVSRRAHPFSPEFIIEDLPRSKFDIITTEDPLVI
jgi:TIR domain